MAFTPQSERSCGSWAFCRADYAIAESSRRILRSFDLERGCELAALELPAALRAISADAERRTIAAVLEDGSLRLLAPRD